MILSGGADGLIAVSSPTTGITIRVISDHQGAPINCIDVTLLQVSKRTTMYMYKYTCLLGTRLPFYMNLHDSHFTLVFVLFSALNCLLHFAAQHDRTLSVAAPQLWLTASADRRVSVWSADWARDFCELVDWLTFPAPAFTPDGTVCKQNEQVSG